MQLPIQVSFRNLERSQVIEDLVYKRAKTLDKFEDRITSCRVVVESPHQHHRRGNLYLVRIDITLPGAEIAVNRESALHREYKSIATALRDAFDSARRQLEDFVRRRRGAVKALESAAHARVSKLFPQENYGFLETPDEREIYFHRHSVLNENFDKLEIGSEVSFVEESGERGPQATTVKLVGRHGRR